MNKLFVYQSWVIPGWDNKAAMKKVIDEGNIGEISIKLANGISSRNLESAETFIPIMRALGVDVTAWHYNYGENVPAEVAVISHHMNKYNIKKLYIDLEAHSKDDAPGVGLRYCDGVREKVDGVKISMCSYRYPYYHREIRWTEYLGCVDEYSPQVYWSKSNNPAWQLRECLRQYRDMENKLRMEPKPFMPAAPAYTEWGWTPKPAELDEFHDTCLELMITDPNFLPGTIWWNMKHAMKLGFIPVIGGHVWPGNVIVPEPEPATQTFTITVTGQNVKIKVVPDLRKDA